jgi:hypothetical protein
MTVDKKIVDKMTVDKMTWYEISFCSLPLKQTFSVRTLYELVHRKFVGSMYVRSS